MHRSASASRVSDQSNSSSSASSSHCFRPDSDAAADKLPTYNPQSHAAKKERNRLRSAETAVHIIPLLLILCAIVLWFFSHPAVDLVNKADSVVARMEGITVGDIEDAGTRSILLSDLELRDLESAKQMADADLQGF